MLPIVNMIIKVQNRLSYRFTNQFKEAGLAPIIIILIIAIGLVSTGYFISSQDQIFRESRTFLVSPSPIAAPISSVTTAIPTLTPLPTSIPTPNPIQVSQLSPTPTPNISTSTTLPEEGYQKMQVRIDSGIFTVDIIAAPVDRNKILVDTATESYCGKPDGSCPVFSVDEYALRSGAWAAINGSFFNPETKSQSSGVVNKNGNQVGPFWSDTMIFAPTDIDLMIDGINYNTSAPFIFDGVSYKSYNYFAFLDVDSTGWISLKPSRKAESAIGGGALIYEGYKDKIPIKVSRWGKGEKGLRQFVASKKIVMTLKTAPYLNSKQFAYIGSIHDASSYEAAKVLETLGMDNALEVDAGGSAALWYQGKYILGPGRKVPDAIIFVKR